jgi:Uma2 family endonuclease
VFVTLTRERHVEKRTIWSYPRPVTFDEWLDFGNPEEATELVDGTVVEKPMVQPEREKVLGWVYHLLALYVQERDSGIVLGSRSPVQISEFRGRMPDLFFVRKDRMEIVEAKATRGAPDLVIEGVSPGDRPSDVNALETDYRSIGVREMVFIDPQKRRVRVLQRDEEAGYATETLTEGALILTTVDGMVLPLSWLFDEPRPLLRATLAHFLDGAEPPR